MNRVDEATLREAVWMAVHLLRGHYVSPPFALQSTIAGGFKRSFTVANVVSSFSVGGRPPLIVLQAECASRTFPAFRPPNTRGTT
jgi:hypothetical protein